MKVTENGKILGEKTVPVSLSTTNPIRTGLGVNPDLRNDRSVNKGQ